MSTAGDIIERAFKRILVGGADAAPEADEYADALADLNSMMAAFEANGTIAAAALTTIQTAAAGLVTSAAGSLRVWSRPTDFRLGSNHQVVSSRVPDLAAVLRSRR